MQKLMIALILMMANPVMAETLMRQIAVVGEGRVEAVPDMATVSIGVIAQAKTGAEALAKNTAKMEYVLVQLKDAGILRKDLQTSNLSLSPRWDNSSSSGSEQPMISGFVASNTLSVRVRDLDKLGEVLDAVVQNGANTFHGLQFGLQEPQPARDAARQDAVADARRKAELYAAAAGVTLGKVMTISEAAGRGINPVMRTMGADMMQSRAVPVEQGELSVTASITVVFEISQ